MVDEVVVSLATLVTSAWRRYGVALVVAPIRTKALTAGVIMGCADMIAQQRNSEAYSPSRSAVMAAYGAC